MSYRGEFTWEPDEDRAQRMRIIGAVALLLAGWAVGFFSGRMSAWLFPVTGTQIVVMEKNSEPPASAPTAEKSPAAAAQVQAPPAADPGTQSTAALQPPPAPPAPSASGGGDDVGALKSESASKTAQPEEPTRQNPTVINAGAAKAKPAAPIGQPPRDPGEQDAATREPAARQLEPAELYRPAYGYQSPGFAAIAECERRYSSFRRSDGTYQPYNRPARERCPLLR